MVIDLVMASEVLGGAATTLGAAYTAFRHVKYSLQSKKDKYRQDIIAEAKEEMAKVEAKMSVRINNLEAELSNQKDNMVRDLGHMKEVYNAEIKVLGEKIDSLRSDLQDQHQSMVNLLTRLVNSK
jgi:polyhydroxyalkanoate synthesis regulator phasin